MKKRKHIIHILLVVLVLATSNKTQAQQVQYARGIVNTLASDAFKGRGYVHNGDKIAADYIANLFQSDSLIPLNGKSYFQPYDLSVNIFPGNMKVVLNNDLLKLLQARLREWQTYLPFRYIFLYNMSLKDFT